MNLLLTNDDNYDSIGLKFLKEWIQDYGNVYICAPKKCHSQSGHKLNFNDPIKVKLKNSKFAIVDASPASCVRIALGTKIFPDIDKFDMVLSGINLGSNLGIDLFVSGTVAATREAAFLGYESIAFSKFYNNNLDSINWDDYKKMFKKTFDWILKDKVDFYKNLKLKNKNGYYNVNFPEINNSKNNETNLPEIKIVKPSTDNFELTMKQIEKNSKHTKFKFIDKSDYNSRIISKNTDLEHCKKHKNITISKIEIQPS